MWKHGVHTRFQKGRVNNPRGRSPTIKHIQQLAREFTDEAVLTLLTIMRGKNTPASARVAAANSILDRGWGKPMMQMDVRLNINDVRNLSDVELLELIAERSSETLDLEPGPGALPAPPDKTELN